MKRFLSVLFGIIAGVGCVIALGGASVPGLVTGVKAGGQDERPLGWTDDIGRLSRAMERVADELHAIRQLEETKRCP